MRVGLIPPRGLENFALQSKFHLALALPELMGRRVYWGMYLRAAELGDFVVLDNGLAEGHAVNPTELRQAAVKLEAKEVVAPDVMKDAKQTIAAVEMFMGADVLPISHMAVAQGTTIEGFKRCVEAFAEFPGISTVGIPRHMLETLNVKPTRIDFANWIQENFPNRFQLHLLGTNPVWLLEVKMATKYAPFIRSVDTSMPFSYAIAGVDLETTSEQIIRPKHYFEHDWSKRAVNATLIRRNINTLMGWADAAGTRTEHGVAKASIS